MAVYAKKLTENQRRALQEYENVSGFEAMGQDEFDSGNKTFAELCEMNALWIEGMAGDAIRALDHDA